MTVSDIEPSKPRSKYDSLATIFDRLEAEFGKAGEPFGPSLAQSFAVARQQREADLGGPTPAFPRSAYASGLEQGLRDLLVMLAASSVRDPSQKPLAQLLHRIIAEEYPDFLAREQRSLKEIVEHGRIRTANQFYRIRSRIDEIEGAASHLSELRQLYRLVDDYESRRSAKASRRARQTTGKET